MYSNMYYTRFSHNSGKNETTDTEHANSLAFTCINGQVYLLILHRNNMLRVWSATSNAQLIYTVSCVPENRPQMQGRE